MARTNYYRPDYFYDLPEVLQLLKLLMARLGPDWDLTDLQFGVDRLTILVSYKHVPIKISVGKYLLHVNESLAFILADNAARAYTQQLIEREMPHLHAKSAPALSEPRNRYLEGRFHTLLDQEYGRRRARELEEEESEPRESLDSHDPALD